jgi:hypothetical protein
VTSPSWSPARRAAFASACVLLADGTSDLRWWDPSGHSGPIELADLPVSEELAAELDRLATAYARANEETDDGDGVMDGLEREWQRESLEARTRELWHRARAELGRRYAIGLLAPGMSRPTWSPTDRGDTEDDDIEF